MFRVKKGEIELGEGKMEYVSFGRGNPLIIIPGFSDALQLSYKNTFGMRSPFRGLHKKFKIFVISYKKPLDIKTTTAEIASDYAEVVKKLKLTNINVLGISLGGMAAQHLASSCSLQLEKLILCSTTPKTNSRFQKIISSWVEMADNEDYNKLNKDTVEKIYTSSYFKLLEKFKKRWEQKPDFKRFISLSEAAREHDSRSLLSSIACKTLIIGGSGDNLVSSDEQLDLKKNIPRSKLAVFPGGHGFWQENRDVFLSTLNDFMKG